MFGFLKRYFGAKRHGYMRFNDRGNWPRSWWQTDAKQYSNAEFGPVFACVQILAQEVAKLPIYHYQINPDGSKTKLTNTAASRVLRKPNHYQTRSDFFMSLMQALLYDGNGYSIARRNDRREIDALYPVNPNALYPHIDPVSGEVIYRLGETSRELLTPLDAGQAVPMRNVLHLRVFTPKHPLCGETPITAACASVALGSSIEANGASFFKNQARPSGLLKVPGKLGKEARNRIKEAWKEAHSQENQGEIGVLSDGAEWQQITMSAQDADLVNTHKMTVEDVARVFRVPLFMLGDMEKTTFNNVESLTRIFYAGALSFYLEHIESALDAIFTLPANQIIQFDFEANLRTNFKERIEGLTAGTTGGLFKINEARAKEGLAGVEGGENVFIQQQLQTVKDRAENKGLDSGEPEAAPVDDTIDDDTERLIATLINKAVNDALHH